MATQNSTITVKGKLGNIVGYKGRDGKRLARIRQTEVKNPKTDGQIFQRMILATASKAYGLMKSITDHSWQGVSYGGVSQSYFLKKAMERIRKFVADSMAVFPSTITDPLQWVGLARPDRLNEAGYGLQISEGTIPSVGATYGQDPEGEQGELILSRLGTAVPDEPQGGYTIKNLMDALGAEVGDQITAVAIYADGSFKRSRYIIKSDASATELNAVWTGDANMAVLDNDSIVTDLNIAVFKSGVLCTSANDNEIAAQAIIISRKENGVWKRSTEYMHPKKDVSVVNAIINLWKLGATEIPTENPFYLNNADA